MSNLLTTPRPEEAIAFEATQSGELQRAISIGSGVVQLTGCTLPEILDGTRLINESSVIYDPNGRKVNTKLILDNVEVA